MVQTILVPVKALYEDSRSEILWDHNKGPVQRKDKTFQDSYHLGCECWQVSHRNCWRNMIKELGYCLKEPGRKYIFLQWMFLNLTISSSFATLGLSRRPSDTWKRTFENARHPSTEATIASHNTHRGSFTMLVHPRCSKGVYCVALLIVFERPIALRAASYLIIVHIQVGKTVTAYNILFETFP